MSACHRISWTHGLVQLTANPSFITVGALGYPLRIDIQLYLYQFSSDTLIKITKSVLATSVVVSSVDLRELDEGTMGAVVEYCYGGTSEENQQMILNKLLKAQSSVRPDAKPPKERTRKSGGGLGPVIDPELEEVKKTLEANGAVSAKVLA